MQYMIYMFITVKKIKKFLYYSRIGVKRESIKSASGGAGVRTKNNIKKYKKTHARDYAPEIRGIQLLVSPLRYFANSSVSSFINVSRV